MSYVDWLGYLDLYLNCNLDEEGNIILGEEGIINDLYFFASIGYLTEDEVLDFDIESANVYGRLYSYNSFREDTSTSMTRLIDKLTYFRRKVYEDASTRKFKNADWSSLPKERKKKHERAEDRYKLEMERLNKFRKRFEKIKFLYSEAGGVKKSI